MQVIVMALVSLVTESARVTARSGTLRARPDRSLRGGLSHLLEPSESARPTDAGSVLVIQQVVDRPVLSVGVAVGVAPAAWIFMVCMHVPPFCGAGQLASGAARLTYQRHQGN